MTARQSLMWGGGLTLAALAYGLWLFPSLPARVPSHWNLHGEVDGWMPRFPAVLFAPGMMALMVGLTAVLPRISPRSFDVEAFGSTYYYVMLLAVGLFGTLHAASLQAALHAGYPVGRWIIAGLCVFFALLGNVLGRTRRNFWMGIRTPWTLADDRVWIATHRLAGRLMVAVGLLGGAAVLLGAPLEACFWVLMAALFLPVAYSLALYKRLEREDRAA